MGAATWGYGLAVLPQTNGRSDIECVNNDLQMCMYDGIDIGYLGEIAHLLIPVCMGQALRAVL